MKLFDTIRDWLRGYSDEDVKNAVRKLEMHWTLPAGSIIPMEDREMRAIVGQNLMPMFYKVRDLEFVNHPKKRKRGISAQRGNK